MRSESTAPTSIQHPHGARHSDVPDVTLAYNDEINHGPVF